MAPQPSSKALFIINPGSRQGLDAELEEGLGRLFKAGIKVEQWVSTSPSASCDAVESRKNDIDLVIIGGGDGTINSMAKTLYDCQLTLAILPLGTANDLARSLGVATSLEDAFSAIINNHRERIDLGCLNNHFFFNAAHIGLGVKVTNELSHETKQHWGVFGYLKALFTALARPDQFTVQLTMNGLSQRMRSMHLAVGNGRYYGGGNIVSEDAYINDGQLSLYSLQPQPFWKLLLLAPVLRGGRQRRDQRVFTATAREIKVRTHRKMAIHADGEPISHTPAYFKTYPAALEAIIAPPTESSPTSGVLLP